MPVATRAGRFGLLLVLLLVLFGVSAPIAPGTGISIGISIGHGIGDGIGDGDAGQHRASVTGESVSAAASMYDDLQDWLRLSAGAPRAVATAPPDTWWAVCPRATDGSTLQGRLRIGDAGRTGKTAAARTPQSSRAPPFA